MSNWSDDEFDGFMNILATLAEEIDDDAKTNVDGVIRSFFESYKIDKDDQVYLIDLIMKVITKEFDGTTYGLVDVKEYLKEVCGRYRRDMEKQENAH